MCDEDFYYYNPYNPLFYDADPDNRMFSFTSPSISVMGRKTYG
jgi:hypothetical protein